MMRSNAASIAASRHTSFAGPVGGLAQVASIPRVYPPAAGQGLSPAAGCAGELGDAAVSGDRRVSLIHPRGTTCEMRTNDDGMLAIRVVLARHRRRRHPDRTRCAWCHHEYPCPQRQHAVNVLQSISGNQAIPDTRPAEMTDEPASPQPGSHVDPYQAANLARELEKALRALHYCRLLLRSKAEGNAALHLDDRVLHLPLTTIVEQGHTSTRTVRDWLRDQAGPDFTGVWTDIDRHPAGSRPPEDSRHRSSDSNQGARHTP